MLFCLLLPRSSAHNLPLPEVGQFVHFRIDLGQFLVGFDFCMQVHELERNVVLLKRAVVLPRQVAFLFAVIELSQCEVENVESSILLARRQIDSMIIFQGVD